MKENREKILKTINDFIDTRVIFWIKTLNEETKLLSKSVNDEKFYQKIKYLETLGVYNVENINDGNIYTFESYGNTLILFLNKEDELEPKHSNLITILFDDYANSEYEKDQIKFKNTRLLEYYFKAIDELDYSLNDIFAKTDLGLSNLRDPLVIKGCFDVISSSNNTIQNILDEISELVKLENNMIETKKEVVDNAFLFSTLKVLEEYARKYHIEFIIPEEQKDHEYYYFDFNLANELITLIFARLFSYSENGQKVEISLDYLDDGDSMLMEFIGKISEGEKQNNNFERNVNLLIIKKLCNLLGGDASSVETKNDDIFYKISVKLFYPTKLQIEEYIKSEKDVNLISGKRFLIVDDQKVNNSIMEYLLKDRGGLVEIVSNGKLAVEKVLVNEDGYYDMIFMDVIMPVMDGLAATMIIHALLEGNTDVPIICLCNSSLEKEVQKMEEAGAKASICKPIDNREFFETIIKHLK